MVIAIWIDLSERKKKRSAGKKPKNLRPVEELLDTDPDFDEAALCEQISNLYVRMQNAWTAKDFSVMRPFFTDSLYQQFDRQLQQIVAAGKTNHIDDIGVLDVSLLGWKEKDEKQWLTARVKTRITIYSTDDKTGEIVSGSRKEVKLMEYEWTLVRASDQKTFTEEETRTVHCPNCGAALSINHSAECPYCGSVVTCNEYGWTISQIRGIAQKTVKEVSHDKQAPGRRKSRAGGFSLLKKGQGKETAGGRNKGAKHRGRARREEAAQSEARDARTFLTIADEKRFPIMFLQKEAFSKQKIPQAVRLGGKTVR